MLKKTKNSENGFAVLEVVLISVFLVAVVAIGAVVYRGRSHLQANNQQTASATITAKPEVQTTNLSASDVAKLQATPPTSTPATTTTSSANTSTSSSRSTTSSTKTTTPTTTPASPPTTTPAPAPAPKASITISADGCMVTATGTPGMALEVGAFTPRKGGAATFTLPASGTKTVSAGGIQGMTSYGQLTDSSGNVAAYGSSTITPATCPPAG